MGTPMPLLVIAWHKQLIDFAGTNTKIVPLQLLEYAFGDRNALVEFLSGTHGVTVKVTFDAETQNPLEQQKALRKAKATIWFKERCRINRA